MSPLESAPPVASLPLSQRFIDTAKALLASDGVCAEVDCGACPFANLNNGTGKDCVVAGFSERAKNLPDPRTRASALAYLEHAAQCGFTVGTIGPVSTTIGQSHTALACDDFNHPPKVTAAQINDVVERMREYAANVVARSALELVSSAPSGGIVSAMLGFGISSSADRVPAFRPESHIARRKRLLRTE